MPISRSLRIAAALLLAVAGSASTAIDATGDRLRAEQAALIERSLASVAAPSDGRRRIYAVAVAARPDALFSREAHTALRTFHAALGATMAGDLLLSNNAADAARTPLATPANVARLLKGLAGRIDPDADTVLFYLVSHGGDDATLETILPGGDATPSVSAVSLRAALAASGIRHRIVVISACFAGSWIPALATPATIVVAAAAANRTSFGCSPDFRLTYFGQAFLEGSLLRGASLEAAFRDAKTTIARRERAGRIEASRPQSYVGREMVAAWRTPGMLGP